MNLEILDNSRLKVDIIKKYDFVQYIDEFTGEGSFQINLPVSEESLKYIVRDNFIVFEEGIVGIIKGIKDSQDESKQIVISGKLTNVILSYRSILTTERYSGTITEISRELVNNHFINPKDSRRKIDLVNLSKNEEFIPESKSINFCETGKNIMESISTMFLPYGYGFELYPIISDLDEENGILNNLSSLEFRVLKPVDRTIDNNDGNIPVVFSFQLDNLTRLEFDEDASSYCSVAIVASEGTGENRKLLEVGETDRVGFNRIELYIDARDIQSTDENGNKITEEELISLMEQRGLEYLEGHKVFTSIDGNVLDTGTNRYVYGKDFYKGDFVSIIDDNYGNVYNLQITSITKSVSKGVQYFDIGFGFDKVMISKIIDTSGKKRNDTEQALTALGGFSFGYTEDGKPGFREAGADTVIPFTSGESSAIREIKFSLFSGDGLIFYPTATKIGDGSFDITKSLGRIERDITFSNIVL